MVGHAPVHRDIAVRLSPARPSAVLSSFLRTALLIAAVAHPLGAATMLAEAESIDGARLGVVMASPGPIRVGRGEIVPAAGASVHALICGDQACGLAVVGPARFSYLVEDRFSQQVARRNLETASSLAPQATPAGMKIEMQLDGALVWSWEAAPAAAPGDTASGLPDWAREVLERPLFSRPSLALLAARRLPAPGMAFALLRAGGDRYLLGVDPAIERVETLAAVVLTTGAESSFYRGRYRALELVAQPIARAWWDRFAAPLVAEHEALRADNDAGSHVAISTRSRVRASDRAVGLWIVGLTESVIDAGHGRDTPIRIKSVTVDGKNADYLLRDNQLFVALEPPLQPGATAEIAVEHDGEYAVRPGGDNFWSLGTWPWYPQPPLNGELATLEIEVRVPAELTPFASGATVSEETKDGFTTLRTRLDEPMQFPVVAAGKYHVFSDTRNGVTCNVASYAMADERGAKRLINDFFVGADFYTWRFGTPYPFDDFNVVEVNSWGFGQAPPAVIFITQEAMNPLGDATDRFFSRGVNERYLHEIAHAWWGHVLKMDSSEEQWLTESFASYSAALALEAIYPGRRGKDAFAEAVRHWATGAKRVGDGGSVYLANHLAFRKYADFETRVYLLYDKGPLVLHALRLELRARLGEEKGDALFFTLLRSFLKNFHFKWGATRHLVGILDQITREDWQPWFERYVYGTEMPRWQ
jgi:hypothetical protein